MSFVAIQFQNLRQQFEAAGFNVATEPQVTGSLLF